MGSIDMPTRIPYFTLNTGAKIPSVGLGTWQADPGVVGEAVISAVKLGYRHIDCALVYGNEKEIGRAFKKLFDDGIVKREDLFITSKLWCWDHHPEDVPKGLETSLQNLQLDYLDLYLVHYPCAYKRGSRENKPENLTKSDVPSTWRAMEELYYSGKARAIGVSNFSTKKLEDLLNVARVPPAVNQVECHPQWQQRKLHDFCRINGIHITAYSPLGSPGNEFMKGDVVLENPIICRIAKKLGKSPAQVTLRWGLQMGHSVLPKSLVEAWTKENLDVLDWSIPEDLFSEFSEIKQAKLLKAAEFVHETYGEYRTLKELWDGEI